MRRASAVCVIGVVLMTLIAADARALPGGAVARFGWGPANAVAWSPDGELLAVAEEQAGGVRVG